MPILPVDQKALTVSVPSTSVYPFARPQSQSMTAFGANDSLSPPTVGQPCDNPVPGEDECTTTKPRGTHCLVCEFEMTGRFTLALNAGGSSCFGGIIPNACFGFQK